MLEVKSLTKQYPDGHVGLHDVSLTVRGVEFPYGTMRRIVDMEDGRYFSEADFAEHRRVVIFGHAAWKKVFQGAPAAGQSVSIAGQQFEVIGVLKTKIQDSMYTGPDDEEGFIPFDVYRELKQERDPEIIVVQPLSLDLNKRALEQARDILGRRHHFNPKDEKATPTWDTYSMMAPGPLALRRPTGIRVHVPGVNRVGRADAQRHRADRVARMAG